MLRRLSIKCHFSYKKYLLKGTWQWYGFSGGFAEIGSSWVLYTTFWAVPILASNSRRYSYLKNDSPLSPIRGVADSPHHWYAESATPRITDTESRLLNFLKENSPYRWYRESFCLLLWNYLLVLKTISVPPFRDPPERRYDSEKAYKKPP
jgi:hypothetical protein